MPNTKGKQLAEWLIASICVATAVIVAVVAQAPQHMPFRLKTQHEMIEEGTWAGFDTVELTERIGTPTATFNSYVQIGLEDRPASMPPGPYVTWRYDHVDGTLYVWFSSVDGNLRSFDSLWFDKGVSF